jgi:hypothetical protein
MGLRHTFPVQMKRTFFSVAMRTSRAQRWYTLMVFSFAKVKPDRGSGPSDEVAPVR